MKGEIPNFDILKVIGNRNKLQPWIRSVPFEGHLIEVLYSPNIVYKVLQEYLGQLIEFKKDPFSFFNNKILGKVNEQTTFFSHPFYTDTKDSVPAGTVWVSNAGDIECFSGKYWQTNSFELYNPNRLRFELIIDPLNWQDEDKKVIGMLESRGDKDEINKYEIPNLGLTLIPKLQCPRDVFDRSKETDFGIDQLQLLLQLCHGLVTNGVDYITKSSRISRYTL